MIHNCRNTADIATVPDRLCGKGVPESIYRDAPGNPGPLESGAPCGPQVTDRFAVIVDDPFAAASVFPPPCPEFVKQVAPQRYLAIVGSTGPFGRAGHESGPGGL